MKERPRGIRNNNPTNLRTSADEWLGKVGDDEGYCIFDTPEHGIRAAAINLRSYQWKHRLFSIAAMITRWAPREDDNDTAAYIANVCRVCGVDSSRPYPLTEVSLTPMIAAMIQQECGENGRQPWFPNTFIRAAVETAFQ